MFSDADFRRLLDDAHAHRAEIDQLIVTLEHLVASGARGRPATPPPKAPRHRTDGKGYLTPTAPPPSSRRPPPLVPAPGRVTLAAAIEQVIALDGPLPTGEIAARVRARGWKTNRRGGGGKNFARAVGTVLFKLHDAGVLRRVDNAPAGPGGRAVYGLAKTSAVAARKLADAVERVNGTGRAHVPRTVDPPRRRPVKTKARTKTKPAPRPKGDVVPLKTLIVGELANSDGLTANDLTARLVAQGWKTTSKEPIQMIRIALAQLPKGAVVVDTSSKPARYRLPNQSAPSRVKRPTAPAPSPTEARENATQE